MNTEEQRQLLTCLYIQLTITYYLATQTRARVKTLTKSSTHYYLSHIVLCTTELIPLSTSRSLSSQVTPRLTTQRHLWSSVDFGQLLAPFQALVTNNNTNFAACPRATDFAQCVISLHHQRDVGLQHAEMPVLYGVYCVPGI